MKSIKVNAQAVTLTGPQRRALTALTRGGCGIVGTKGARVWCEADPVGILYHRATFDALVGLGCAGLKPSGDYVITVKGLSSLS